ncbi:hypothetical protein N5C81_14940 [Rhizobium pusense]|uniref:DUF4376 domain-containing protein n=1 Tax=Agrobacterium pusense TaxID=648995 RepID=UPI0024498081|nr:hypothetical protein [Agrobacterium pusense]MDH1268919.1 hypothetical protein [Agrobacterium pusense]
MFAVINNSGLVCALRETDDPIADVFTIIPVDPKETPSVGDSASLGQSGAWIFTAPTAIDISAVKAARVEALRLACEAAITGGFKSSALGAMHTYPSDIKAQINLMGSVTDSLMPDLPTGWSTPFWVCDAQGNWKWEAHTASQIQQAGRDGKAAVVAAQTKLGELTAAVEAAKTKKAVEAITW